MSEYFATVSRLTRSTRAISDLERPAASIDRMSFTVLPEGGAITMEQLRPYGDKLSQADFLLFNLGWDEYWGTDAYFGDCPCIDDEVLDLIIAGGYKGIGFDVIGLDPIADTNLTRHKKLFSSCDIVNIENLKNLDCCGDDLFWFSCCPLKIEDSDGAPIRAIAWFE